MRPRRALVAFAVRRVTRRAHELIEPLWLLAVLLAARRLEVRRDTCCRRPRRGLPQRRKQHVLRRVAEVAPEPERRRLDPGDLRFVLEPPMPDQFVPAAGKIIGHPQIKVTSVLLVGPRTHIEC